MLVKFEAKEKRQARVRRNIKGRNKSSKPRFSVFRSNKNLHVQIIDDVAGVTLASASTLSKDFAKMTSRANVKAAVMLGGIIAVNAKKAGVTEVVFDKGPCKYHGVIKALADAARESKILLF